MWPCYKESCQQFVKVFFDIVSDSGCHTVELAVSAWCPWTVGCWWWSSSSPCTCPSSSCSSSSSRTSGVTSSIRTWRWEKKMLKSYKWKRNVCRKTRHANQNFIPRKYSCPRWNKEDQWNIFHFRLIQLKSNTSKQFVFSVTFQNKSPLKKIKRWYKGKGNKLYFGKKN